MKKIILILIILFLANTVNGQEILTLDNSRSYVINIDDGGKKYLIEDFMKSNKLSFLEGQKMEAHFFIIRNPSSNPKDSYVFEMRTDLMDAEWQYKIFGETKVIKAVKTTVWDVPGDHSASSFEIVLNGNIPKPAIKIEEPYFKGYIGEGPGYRNSALAIFTIYDGHEAINKVQDVGVYPFLSTNSDIKKYLEEIQSNLDTSNLNIEYSNALAEQKEYILRLGNEGHVGMAYDLSRSFAKFVEELKSSMPEKKNSKNTMFIAIIGGIILALITGFAGYKVGQGGEKVSSELIDQMDRSYNTLKQNVDKLEKIDISNIPGAEKQAMEIETIKRQVTPSVAGLKTILNQLR